LDCCEIEPSTSAVNDLHPGQRRLVLRIGPVLGGCVAVVSSHSLAAFGRIWAVGRCAMD